MPTKIETWPDIASGFSESLILGNGTSVAVSPVFAYKSLLAEARSAHRLSSGVEALFARLATSDFEFVLEKLWHAEIVTECLGIPSVSIHHEYQLLRAALIATIRAHHPAYDGVTLALPGLFDFLRGFSTVVSLNYDLLVYWSMLAGNEKYGVCFKDGFLDGEFEEDWSRFRKPTNNNKVTMVFYPHGNLILAATVNGQERKLAVGEGSGDLLETVMTAWESGDYHPIFVAEGETTQKLAAIGRSSYLRRVYAEVLPDLGESVAVFGWGAAENDTHILKQIVPRSHRLAFSVFRGSRSHDEIDSECLAIRSRVARINRRADVIFYWSP